MNEYQFFLTSIVVQQAVMSAAWLAMCFVRVGGASIAPLGFLCNVLLTFGTALVAARGLVPHWLGFWVSGVSIVVALIVMRRTISTFFDQPHRRVEEVVIVAMTMVGITVAYDMANAPLRIVTTQLAGTWLIGQCAWMMQRQAAKEFSVVASRWLSAPLWFITAAFLARCVAMVFVPDRVTDSGPNAAVGLNVFAMAVMFSALLINMILLSLIILRVVKQIRRLSMHDPMTDLLNRRAIEEALAREMARFSRRPANSMSLLVLDLDHFKAINDSHGHPGGDQVLVALAKQLREAARDGDYVARAGGEEFWVLLPETDAAGALALSERVRQDIEQTTHVIDGAKVSITVSMGVATYQSAQETAQELFHRADRALYVAKAQGRNRVVVADAYKEMSTDLVRFEHQAAAH
jgi:diguanylate cyclase (GGDEF)-like protein